MCVYIRTFLSVYRILGRGKVGLMAVVKKLQACASLALSAFGSNGWDWDGVYEPLLVRKFYT